MSRRRSSPPAPRFDARWQAKRRRKAGWRRWSRIAGLVLVTAALTLGLRWWHGDGDAGGEWVQVQRAFSLCGRGQSSAACVIDGDTVWLPPPAGSAKGAPPRRIRLAGFDAPELEGACEAERTAAIAARGALLAWLRAGPFEWNGGAEPPRDQYGRELRNARRTAPDGTRSLLAEHMRGAGLAGGSGWGESPIDWCDPAR
ncbi:thermonuclease family protein [Paraurantiacibacter namhicola]|uniref:TNase-like domain-containing protein n=1 Tax=Paraurantiacibacter namhicola TaxID=645517 RepID=A0A1C7D6D2_9SPHN|nr:hypothetical protein [Paraurantiacibacter namhicola]ANU07014.1 hypothetical protein A6F65_00692 [Paraurantiacibacter namhicola]